MASPSSTNFIEQVLGDSTSSFPVRKLGNLPFLACQLRIEVDLCISRDALVTPIAYRGQSVAEKTSAESMQQNLECMSSSEQLYHFLLPAKLAFATIELSCDDFEVASLQTSYRVHETVPFVSY